MTDVYAEVNDSIDRLLADFYNTQPVTMGLTLVGETPLLMNNPAAMKPSDVTGSVAKRATIILPPEEEAESKTYRNLTGELVLPARCITRSFQEAAKGFKDPQRPRAALTRSFVAGVRATQMDFTLVDPESGDALSVVEPYGARVTYGSGKSARSVVAYRPKVEAWQAFVTLHIEPSLIQPGQIAAVAAKAGREIGVLDWRPEKGGPFGIFRVEHAEVLG